MIARRAKQIAYNEEHGITPATVKKNVEDILSGLYQGDVDMNRVTAKIDPGVSGGNLQTVLDGLRTDMRKAAENLEFEEAARLRCLAAARSTYSWQHQVRGLLRVYNELGV